MRRRRIVVALALPALLVAGIAGSAMGKAHVPAGDVQISHRGIVKQLPAQALAGHLRHGDFQLPACDFNNVFLNKGDASGVADDDGDGFADAGLNERSDAGGITPACPAGTF